MLACGKCIHKNVCEFCKAMGFEDVVRANDFDCKDFMPADDVQEVVRCEKCKHSFDAGMSGMYCEHPDNIMPLGCNPDDFCSYGERKEGK